MENSDDIFSINRDWDPSYLSEIFNESFDDCSTLWLNGIDDSVLNEEMDKYECYETYSRRH